MQYTPVREGPQIFQDKECIARAQNAYDQLKPKSLLMEHAWLFNKSWVEHSADEVWSDQMDFEEREKRFTRMRIDALRAIITEYSLLGALRLAEMGQAGRVIGFLLSQIFTVEDEQRKMFRKLIDAQPESNLAAWKALMSGFLDSVPENHFSQTIAEVTVNRQSIEIIFLLLLAPFQRRTWKFLDTLGDHVRAAYWKEAIPTWGPYSAEDTRLGVELLMKASRPRAAFWFAQHKLEELPPKMLFRIMQAIPLDKLEKPGFYQAESYHITQAFRRLTQSGEIPIAEMASLEFQYLDALDQHDYGIPNLEKQIEEQPSGQDSYTVQGDVYGGQQNTMQTLPIPVSPFSATTEPDDTSYGGNILARWNHQISNDSSTSLQAYIDHYSLLEQDIADQHVSTADIQFQNNVKLDDRNNFIWGAGGRFYYEDILGTFEANVNNPSSTHYIFNTFAQDEYALVQDKVFLTLGSKFEYNDYTGFEVEPSSRIAWHITSNQMVWAAVSRAVRTPSSIEEDVSVAAEVLPGTPPTALRIEGNPDQKDEDLVAYEIGHRIQPVHNLSFDTTAFYNDFTNLLTLGPPGTPFFSNGLEVVPYEVNNLGAGHAYGAEEAATWNVTNNWRLMGSYTYLMMDLNEPPSNTQSLAATQALAPHNQFSIRSYWNITDTVQWDNMLYYVSAITAPVDTYFRYDTRIGWQVVPGVEASLIGRNLLDNEHAEFPATPQAEIPRSALAQISWKF
jgi:hypothetical protein